MGQSNDATSPLKKVKSFEQFEQAQNWDKPEPHLPPTQQKRTNAIKKPLGSDIFDIVSNTSKISQTSSLRVISNHFANQRNKQAQT